MIFSVAFDNNNRVRERKWCSLEQISREKFVGCWNVESPLEKNNFCLLKMLVDFCCLSYLIFTTLKKVKILACRLVGGTQLLKNFKMIYNPLEEFSSQKIFTSIDFHWYTVFENHRKSLN